MCTRNRADHDYAAIFLVLWSRILIITFRRGLTHGWRGILERKEGSERVCLEALLQVARRGRLDRLWAEHASVANPDIQPRATRLRH